MFALAVAAAIAASPGAKDSAVAEITRLEQQWGEAFVKRDFAFIERIVAPEYRLVGTYPDGSFGIIRRAEWMKNSRAFTHHAFAVETVDVNHAGNTVVASAQGLWTVTMRPGEPPRAVRFFVTDTWVRRHAQWQVIHRYSQSLPGAAWPPVASRKPAAK
ncbi:MAG: nuclear transport factor 2 family protein [Sphingomonas bacterium]|nr:nuclear transport factor 2 family protein [Sphingomonas bacterium]